jgi:DNA-binding MarR family transcriptional regulator
MDKETRERTTKLATTGVILALGAAALRKKEFLEETRIKTVHYYNASRDLWMELIEHGTMKANKFAARTKVALSELAGLSREEIAEQIELPEDFEIPEEQLAELEEAFPHIPDAQTNPLQKD